MSTLGSLFKRVVRLNDGTDTPAWEIQVWDDDTHEWVSLTGSRRFSSGSPIEPGLVTLQGDPPDFVTINGDTITVIVG